MATRIGIALTLFVFTLFSVFLGLSLGQLEIGFYNVTCPAAENTVRDVVTDAIASNRRSASILLRLQYHDCFVEGCDASILIGDGRAGEGTAIGHLGLGGFDIIQEAKTRIERVCSKTVSCADIVALAARDAIFLSKGRYFEVPTGRKDGKVSDASLAVDFPNVNDSTEALISKFSSKGLSEKDLVILSGAHTIGTAACFFMMDRLYNFSGTGKSDPTVDPFFLPELKSECPFNQNLGTKIPLDPKTNFTFDNQIFKEIQNGRAVLATDGGLYTNKVTKKFVDVYGTSENSFLEDFTIAIIKMGLIGAKNSSQGDVRQVCGAFNT